MTIKLESLGLNWFDELKECVKMLAENIDASKINGGTAALTPAK